MAESYLAHLSPDLLVEALSYITYNSAQLAWFGILCRPVRATLCQDAAWRHLCCQYWHATEERFRQWTDFSPRGLYRALEQWVPLEGYYVLAPAFPWGLLVLIRIDDGRVLADVIRFVPREDGSFEEVPVPLFRVALHEERPGVVRSVLDAPWSGGAAMQLSGLDPRELRARTELSSNFIDRSIVRSRLFAARRALRVAAVPEAGAAARASAASARRTAGGDGAGSDPGSDSGSNCEDDEVLLESRHREWLPVPLFKSQERATEHTQVMLQQMLGAEAIPCDLALIRSPKDFCRQDSGFPGVRPGLYVGDYGHALYGQFRTEVLLLEYATFNPEDALADASASIFARPEGGPAPSALRLLSGVSGGVTFMRGVKQCGDLHVPMGATTFAAVCGPPAACAALAQGLSPPGSVLNRQSGQAEAVRRAWRGMGTLAMPGFRGPNWDGGWLVQLVDDGVNGDHRFGFVWDRQQDAVVLRWVAAQDACPFLQRAWLPEDLR